MASDEEVSDDNFESPATDDEQSECKFIAQGIKRYPEILEKSQLPAKKAKKQAAIEKVITEYGQLYGKEMTAQRLMKKVGNMKTRLKKKTDKNKTGNKRIPPLRQWEVIMMEAMDVDINPTLAQIPGGLEIGPSLQFNDNAAVQRTPQATVVAVQCTPQPIVVAVQRTLQPTRKIGKLNATATEEVVIAHETEETKKLTTSQLQRLVLLEQLKVARLQQEYFSAKLKNRVLPPAQNFYIENENTFEILH